MSTGYNCVCPGGICPHIMSIEPGSITKGTVVKILDYGAIVRLDASTTGLIHISEITESYVQNVRDYLNENDEVTVRVLRFGNKGRYELSIKQCEAKPEMKPEKLEAVVSGGRRTQDAQHSDFHSAHSKIPSFEDKLSHFLKESDERLHELRRGVEGKRKKR